MLDLLAATLACTTPALASNVTVENKKCSPAPAFERAI